MDRIEIDFTNEKMPEEIRDKLIPLMIFPEDKEGRYEFYLMRHFYSLPEEDKVSWIRSNPDDAYRIIRINEKHKDYSDMFIRLVSEALSAALIVKFMASMGMLELRGGASINKAVWLYEQKGKGSERTARNHWKKFKPVAHLWASYIDNCLVGHQGFWLGNKKSECYSGLSERARAFVGMARGYKEFLLSNGVAEANCMKEINVKLSDRKPHKARIIEQPKYLPMEIADKALEIPDVTCGHVEVFSEQDLELLRSYIAPKKL